MTPTHSAVHIRHNYKIYFSWKRLYQTFCCFCVTSLCNMSSELQKLQTIGFLIWSKMTFQYWKCPQCHKSFFWKERGLPHAFLHTSALALTHYYTLYPRHSSYILFIKDIFNIFHPNLEVCMGHFFKKYHKPYNSLYITLFSPDYLQKKSHVFGFQPLINPFPV